jgi:serine/threonine protein kinase
MCGSLFVNVALIGKPQGNVLIDGSGNPRLADFGLATVAEVPELQWTMTTLERNFDARWRAPEVIGIEHKPERPTFKSDIYSLGSVMFFVRYFFSL